MQQSTSESGHIAYSRGTRWHLCLSQTFVSNAGSVQVELDKLCALIQSTTHQQLISYTATTATIYLLYIRLCPWWVNRQICHSVKSCCPCCLFVLIIAGRYLQNAFSALKLLAGCQQEHPACKSRLMRCCYDYLSEARCRLFAYSPADATAIPKLHNLLPHLNPDWFYHSGTSLPRLSWKKCR